MRRIDLPLLFIRLSLGLVFLWIGLDIVRHPETWIGFIPPSLPLGLSRELALKINSFFDISLGALLILGAFRKVTSSLAALHLGAILITQGLNAVVIRDAGLLGAALALFFWPSSKRHRGGWLRKWF